MLDTRGIYPHYGAAQWENRWLLSWRMTTMDAPTLNGRVGNVIASRYG